MFYNIKTRQGKREWRTKNLLANRRGDAANSFKERTWGDLWSAFFQLREGFPAGNASIRTKTHVQAQTILIAQYRLGLLALTLLPTALNGARLSVFVFGNLML